MKKLPCYHFAHVAFSRGTVFWLRAAGFVSFNKLEKGKRWGGECDNQT